jgi:carboxyl-terminal processing protease
MLRVARWTVGALLVATLIAFAFSVGYLLDSDNDGGSAAPSSPASVSEPSDGNPDFRVLNEILDILQRDYVDPGRIDGPTLFEAAVNGLLDTLSDSGTFYVDPATYQVSVMPSGTFEGIGATVSEQDGQIVIVAPIRGTPAEAAGIVSGDVIIAVDGESTEGWTVDKAVLKIRGPRGTDVVLTIRHPEGDIEDITITRDEIKVESVSTVPPGGELEDADGNVVTDIAYVRIQEFTSLTPSELKPVLEEVSDGNYEGLIVDLRSNPGGLLDATVNVADMFLDSGDILFEVPREGNERVFDAKPGGEATEIPLTVLVDRFSASGAEVLSAALADNGRAVVIGEQTFGKGTVNVARQLEDGGALFVSIARWLTPDRIQIDGVGIRPDIEVIPSDEDIDLRRDVQVQRAVEYLRSLQASVPAEPAVVP